MDGDSTESGTDLSALLGQIADCRACSGELAHDPRPVVRVSGAVRLLICGQAPGRRVHESGVPFDDPSGDRLRGWMGVDRKTFYERPEIGVAAMAFCFPGTRPRGGDYPPPPRCAQLWRKPLMAALPQMDLTLLVGTYAQKWSLEDRVGATLTETVASWRRYLPLYLPMPHPSWRNTGWLKRNPWFESDVLPYLRHRVADILNP
jgi:uracil-DNA glycosylase